VTSIFAHRGDSSVSPGNTVEAFCAARRSGADGVELDVRCSADGGLVVHHDPEIPGLGPVASLDVGALPPEVPLLEAAVAACGELNVNIELKDLPGEPGYDPSGPLAVMVARFVVERGLSGRVIVSSFDLSAIDVVRATEPLVPTGWLTLSGFDQARALRSVIDRGHDALHPHHLGVTTELVQAAHDAGIDVNTWTVDEPERIRQVAAAGVDVIITNVPSLARTVLTGA
jgi:glycerophosphoryl diester phosphodiesterase